MTPGGRSHDGEKKRKSILSYQYCSTGTIPYTIHGNGAWRAASNSLDDQQLNILLPIFVLLS
eukprot:scaffold578_cov167-Amphora_coffeaeformis.AAC.12